MPTFSKGTEILYFEKAQFFITIVGHSLYGMFYPWSFLQNYLNEKHIDKYWHKYNSYLGDNCWSVSFEMGQEKIREKSGNFELGFLYEAWSDLIIFWEFMTSVILFVCSLAYLAYSFYNNIQINKWVSEMRAPLAAHREPVGGPEQATKYAIYATKQLYEWYFAFVRLSHIFHYVPIILSSWNFQELLPMTKVRSMQKVKVRGQRSRSQRSNPT